MSSIPVLRAVSRCPLLLIALLVSPVPSWAQVHLTDSGQALGSAHSRDVALGDLDGDGDLDAWVANTTFLVPGPNRVWINQGGDQAGLAGSFVESGQSLGDGSSQSVALGDLDGDGDLDAVVGNLFNGTDAGDRVWINDGNAVFSAATQALGIDGTSDVALADLDGDGDLDTAAANADAAVPNALWINQGNSQSGVEGTFTAGGSLGTARAEAVVLEDLDGDGDIDAALGVSFGSPPANEIWINQGGLQGGTPGAFIDSGQRLGDRRTLGLTPADFDGDGDIDLFASNSGLSAGDVLWLNQGGMQQGTPGVFVSAGAHPNRPSSSAAAGDFDGDGDADLLVTHFNLQSGRENAVWLNDGSAGFADSGLAVGNSGSQAVALGDLDADGDLDAFVANDGSSSGAEANRVWLGGAPVTGQPSADLALDARPQGTGIAEWHSASSTIMQASMTVDVTNRGPDPATDVTLDFIGDNPIASSSEFSCQSNGTEGRCRRSSLGVGQTASVNLTAFQHRWWDGVYRGTAGVEARVSANEPDPVSGPLSVSRSVDYYDCSGGCFIQAVFCLINFGLRPRGAHAFDVDLPVYHLLRQLMNHGETGRRLVQRYAAHQAEILSLAENDDALMARMQSVLHDWQPALRALVTGRGAESTITQAEVDGLDALLLELEQTGSLALSQAIAEERTRIGPLTEFVGLSMHAAAKRVIPSDLLRIDGFERPETLND